MSPKKFLIIGSNCFTGSHIVDELLNNTDHEVVGLSRSQEYKPIYLPYKARQSAKFTFHQIDVLSQFDRLAELIQTYKPNVVINVAALSEVALSNEQPIEYFETNTLAVVKLCNLLRSCDFLDRYVHISSAEVLGSCNLPMAENEKFNPSTPYAVSKAAADLYINTLIANFNFPAILYRSTNVYGKHQQLYKIIPRTVIYLKMGKLIELHGGGTAIKAFVHIRDITRGIRILLEKGATGTYHFSVDNHQTVADVVRKVCEKMGCPFDKATRVVGERLGQDARYWLDMSKVNRQLGWHPEIDFDEGVREVIEWIDTNWEVIKKEPLQYIHKTRVREPMSIA